jgi:hypothetical protein
MEAAGYFKMLLTTYEVTTHKKYKIEEFFF